MLGVLPLSTLAQGSLTPSGPPAPTMKSLDQIEPRTPISSLPFTITTSGSYYLTTNLTAASNGITISTNNVTLDLNGFALVGLPASGKGISFTAQTNVTVRNGVVSGWGSGGVYAALSDARNLVFERLVVSGCGGSGILCGGQGTLRNCVVSLNGSIGIALYGGEITDCEASYNGSGGISAIHCIVRNCRAANNGTDGIYIAPGTVLGCLAENNGFSGIYVDAPGSTAIGNTCIGNNTSANATRAGIYVNDANNRIEDNHVTASGYAGISVNNFSTYTNNIIIKNSVRGNGANNYVTPGNQIVGPLITTYGTITNSNPWANFSY